MTGPDGRSPLDQALDLVFFGPLGLALTAREDLPKMVEKGRQRMSSQVMLARMIGQHAVKHGQKVAGSAIKQSTDTLVGLGIIPGHPAPAAATAAAPAARSEDSAPAASPAGMGAGAGAGNGNGGPVAGPPPAPASLVAGADLAIPGYDSLSASQVVQRLAGLAPGELEAVRIYEAAGRGRRTILNRIVQLQTGRP